MKKTLVLFMLLSVVLLTKAQNIALGKNGALVTSTDGGNTWINKNPTLNGATHDVVGISKYSTNNWVISQFKSGSGNFIQRTTDGGVSYTTLATNLNGTTNYQQEMAHFGPDTLLLLSRLLTNNSTEGHSFSTLSTATPPLTFANGGTSRSPYLGLAKYNGTSALVINNQTNGMPISSSSEVYRAVTKTATAGAYCFTLTSGIYENPQLTGSVRLDASTLFTVGNINGFSYSNSAVSGYLYKSTDNGATWSIVNLPSIPGGCGLMGIDVSPNGQNIVVSGSKGYVARSSDSGASWNASVLTGVQGTAANWVYNKVAFADDNTVLVGGSDQVTTAGADWYILRSTDGGANFTALTTLTDPTYTDFTEGVDRRGSYHSIYFVSATVGYAVMGRADKGKKYEIMKTTDGGATWSLITWATGAKPNVAAVEVINHLSNENDLVVNSLAGKNLWQINVATTPVVAGSIVSKYTTKDLRGVYKKSATELYALEQAALSTEGGIYASTDGGLSWTLATTAIVGQPMLTITNGFVGGYLGRAYIANADFSVLNRTAVQGHYGGVLIDLASTYKNLPNTHSTVIYAIGEMGTVLKSTNTGATFTSIGKLEWSGYTYTAISAVDDNTVFISGYNASDKGVIFKTTNGGTDWTKVEFENIGKLNDIAMFSATNGLAVGNGGVILGTVDGINWVSKSPAGLTDDLLKVVCDEQVAVTGVPEIISGLTAPGEQRIVSVEGKQLYIQASTGARVVVYNLLGVQEQMLTLATNSAVVSLSDGAKIIRIEEKGVHTTHKVIVN